MIRRLLATGALGLFVSGPAIPQSDSGYLDQQRRMARLHVIDLVREWLESTSVPGCAVALVEGDQTLFLEGFGVADTDEEGIVDPLTTVFVTGQLVRAMTATAVLQLAERGALELQADPAGQSGLRRYVDVPFGHFTPTDLLLHTAGIDPRVVATRARDPEELEDLDIYLRRRMPAQVRPPGTVSVPSTHGYALAGRLVEIASGQRFDTYLSQQIFEPLGMIHTSVGPVEPPVGRVATGYRQGRQGWVPVLGDFCRSIPASGLLTSAGDMATWMKAVLSPRTLGNRRILDREGVAQLLEPQFSHHPSLPGRTLAFQQGQRLSPREIFLTSTGNGFSSVLGFLPERRVGFFVALNSEADVWDLASRILAPFDSPAAQASDVSPLMSAWPEVELDGFWQDASISRTTAERLLSLVRQDRIRQSDDGVLRWRRVSFEPQMPPCFAERGGDTRLCVVEGENGELYLAIGALVLVRLDWFATWPVQMALWIAFTTCFLVSGWPRLALPNRHGALRPDDSYPPRWPTTFARVAAALHFLFIALLTIFLAIETRTGANTLLYDVPVWVLAALTLPLLAAALTMIAASGLGLVWRSSHSWLADRLRFTILILVLLAFLPFLWSWNLLGYQL